LFCVELGRLSRFSVRVKFDPLFRALTLKLCRTLLRRHVHHVGVFRCPRSRVRHLEQVYLRHYLVWHINKPFGD
jgi:hypothetical protein